MSKLVSGASLTATQNVKTTDCEEPTRSQSEVDNMVLDDDKIRGSQDIQEEAEDVCESGQQEAEAEAEEEVLVEEPYQPPLPNFIYVLNRDNKPLAVNNRCRKTILQNYIKQKMDIKGDCEVDFCSLEGEMVRIVDLQPNDYVTDKFVTLHSYIPCHVTRHARGPGIAKIEPLVDDWQKNYPKLSEALESQVEEIKPSEKPVVVSSKHK